MTLLLAWALFATVVDIADWFIIQHWKKIAKTWEGIAGDWKRVATAEQWAEKVYGGDTKERLS